MVALRLAFRCNGLGAQLKGAHMRVEKVFLAACVAMAGVLGAAGQAAAQTDSDLVRRLERQFREHDASMRLMIPSDQPISERLLIDYGAVLRFGFYAIDDERSNTRILRQSDARLYMRVELDGAHRFFGQLKFLYNDFNSGDSFNGDGDDFQTPIGDRYWYEFDLRGAKMAETGQRTDYNVNVRAGKQFIQWGSGLTLSNALYAGLVDVEYKDLGFIGLGGITPSSDTVDFDGSRPSFDTDTSRAFFGGTFEYRGLATHRPYVFVLVQQDNNDRDFTEFPSLFGPIPTRFNYDSNYAGIGSRGSFGPNWRYRAELVYEWGEGLSNSFDTTTGLAVAQTEEDISAYAGIGSLTYLFRDARDTRLDFEMIAGSGDKDRVDSSDTFGGNKSGTDDTAFNSLGYVNTGLALAPEVSNLFSFRTGLSTTAFERWGALGAMRVGVSGFVFAKLQSDAPLNVHTTTDNFVGGEIDVFVDWRLTSDLGANLRYGVFLPGDAMPDEEDDPRHFFYAGVTYAF